MGKAPAFQFYVRDWLSDPQLRQASPASRGIWIDCLCYMWESPIKGEVEGTAESLGRLLGITQQEFEAFMEETRNLRFADVHIDSEKIPPVFHLKNRRMSREESQRETARGRKQKQRERDRLRKQKNKGRKSHAEGHADVTPLSSSSSSSSLKSSSLRSEDFSPAVKDAAGDPPVLTLPVLGGGEYPVTQAQVSRWAEAYPAVDVPLSLRQMREWLESNPTKKRRNVRRFITNWLKREQERGGNRGRPQPAGNRPQPQGVMVPWN